MKDTLGRYVIVNKSFCEYFGLKEDQILGRTDRELFNEKLAIQLREADLEILVSRTSKEYSETLSRSGGDQRQFLINRFPLMDSSDKNPYAVGAVAVDVSNQVQVQNSLIASENRYRSIVEDRFVFVCRHKPDGNLTYTNTSFANQFGPLYESKLGEKFEKIVAQLDLAKVKREIASISPAHPLVQYEHRVATEIDSQFTWIRWIHRGIFDGQGQISEYQAVGFDVTESQVKTQELLERDSTYSSVFDNTVDFISIYRVEKDDFILESLNQSAAKGSSSSALIGQKLSQFVSTEAAEKTLKHFKKARDYRISEVYEEELLTPYGSKCFSTTIVPIPGVDNRIEKLAAISRDVSAAKRIETELRKAKNDAEVANKSKSDFLASMSHELRTPLNVVIGMSQLLLDTPLDNEQSSYLGSVYRSGKVLLTLIEDILDVAKIEAGKVSLDAISFNPAEVITEVIDLFSPQARDKGVQLIGELSNEVETYVIGDPARLHQVLLNLVGNALKFTDKGQVKIEAKARFDSTKETQLLEVKVHDTGIGIPKEAHHRLFQRFSQIDSGNSRRYGGSGLGLVISKHLVSMMNGVIDFESRQGHGSTFQVTIPLPVSKFQEPRKNSASLKNSFGLHPMPIRSMKILAVDDSEDSRAVIGHFLRKLGQDVTLSSGGYDALQKISATRFDLVLMDIQMPDIDGYEVTSRIRSLHPDHSRVPVIALTANAMTGDSKKAFDAGMDDYITKPIHIDALKALLKKWVDRV